MEDGFSTVLPDGQKHLPLDSPPKCSILTLSINPSKIRLFRSPYASEKIQITFTDRKEKKLRYISLTDLGMLIYAEKFDDAGLTGINGFRVIVKSGV